MLPREVSSKMSASSFIKSSVRKGPALYTPATSIFPHFTNIRESASRSSRFSAATNTRGLPPARTSSFGGATFSSLPTLARRSPLERALFCPCSGTTKLCLAPASMAGHPPCLLAHPALPNIPGCDWPASQTYLSLLQFLSRLSVSSNSPPDNHLALIRVTTSDQRVPDWYYLSVHCSLRDSKAQFLLHLCFTLTFSSAPLFLF